MFRLRQITRRQLCRAGFVLGCLSPLLALTVWGTYRHSPVHGQSEQWSLRQALGVRVGFSTIAHPRPGTVRYNELVLADAETGKPIATCRQAEYRKSALKGDDRLTLSDLTIEPDGLAGCHALLQRLLRRERGTNVNLTLAIDSITIADRDTAETWAASGVIRASDEESTARFVIGPQNSEPSAEAGAATDRILLRFERDHSTGTPTDKWELHSGDDGVPCSWLMAIVGDLPGLKTSRLHGSIWVRDAAAGQMAVRGRVTDVNLAAIVRPYFGHFIEGNVEVEFAKPAHFQNGRIVEMRGTVIGGAGRLGRSLLAAASTALGCEVKYESSNEVFAYDRLAFEFFIDAQGRMAIVGIPERGRPLVSNQAGQGLLYEPRTQPQPAVNLARAIAIANAPSVPATPQAALVLSRLPTATPIMATRMVPDAQAPTATRRR